jgi:Protein tyrosine phosphatase-like protein, PTPLA
VADFTGLYNQEENKIERIFKWLELAPLLELVHHLIGISRMKTHIFLNMLINLWIVFGVIEYNRDSPYVMHWVILRCVQKTIRHFYNAYSAMDLKFEVYAIDYIRMTSFYVLYPAEYIYSLVLVINTLPKVK